MDDKISVFGLCVNDTITACLKNGLTKKADRMKLDFKVPDKRYVQLGSFER